MTQSRARSLAADDRSRILRELDNHRTGDFQALRTRALVLLAMCSSLRLSECLALNVAQVAETGQRGVKKVANLADPQAKGGNGGPFVITSSARQALLAYMQEARKRGWLDEDGPLFIGQTRGKDSRGDRGSHPRLSRWGGLRSWKKVQQKAGVRPLYTAHDLRHDSGTRFARAANGDAYRVSAHMRLIDVRTSLRYVHTDAEQLLEVAEVAMRRRR